LKSPDFFIVGTMKSGTTILYESICTHPLVAESKQKEIHYFSLYPYKGTEWYLSHFEQCQNYLCGDASPSYFDFAHSETIPRQINSFAPTGKILLIIRDPIERAVSHFYHMKKIVKPKWLESACLNEFFSQPFSTAVRQTSSMEWLLNQILWCSCYFRKFLYYRGVFQPERLFILTNDQLRHEPVETMKRTFRFLDLDYVHSDFFGEFKYSLGSSVKHLDRDVHEKLKDYLYPDFRKFLNLAQVHHSYDELT